MSGSNRVFATPAPCKRLFPARASDKRFRSRRVRTASYHPPSGAQSRISILRRSSNVHNLHRESLASGSIVADKQCRDDKNVKLMLFCSHCLRRCATFAARLDEPLLLAWNYILHLRFPLSYPPSSSASAAIVAKPLTFHRCSPVISHLEIARKFYFNFCQCSENKFCHASNL